MRKTCVFLMFIIVLTSFTFAETSSSSINWASHRYVNENFCLLNAPSCIFLGNITFAGDVSFIGNLVNITVHNLIINATEIVGLNDTINESMLWQRDPITSTLFPKTAGDNVKTDSAFIVREGYNITSPSIGSIIIKSLVVIGLIGDTNDNDVDNTIIHYVANVDVNDIKTLVRKNGVAEFLGNVTMFKNLTVKENLIVENDGTFSGTMTAGDGAFTSGDLEMTGNNIDSVQELEVGSIIKLGAGPIDIGFSIIDNDIAISSGVIESTSGTINFDDENLVTTEQIQAKDFKLLGSNEEIAIRYYEGANKLGELVWRGNLPDVNEYFGFQNFLATGGLRFYNRKSVMQFYAKEHNVDSNIQWFSENAGGSVETLRMVLGTFSNVVNLTLTDTNIVSDGDITIEGNFTGNQIQGAVSVHPDGNITVIINTQNVHENITGFNVNTTNGFKAIGDHSLEVQVSGTYAADFWLSIAGGANKLYESCIVVNGVHQEPHAHARIATGGDVSPMSGGGVIDLTEGDIINLQIRNTQGTQNVDIFYAGMRFVRTGD